jgi:glycine/sarcosine N-methyltransferase
MDAREFYDELGGEYDLMVSWEGRLAREDLFFRTLFDGHGVTRVLDAACGTGMHAIAFARQGRSASGVDISAEMIERARENARRSGVEVQWRVAGFGGIAPCFEGAFDAVTCLGNSLPHLLGGEELVAALADFARLLAPTGILVIQNRNYDKVMRSPARAVHLNARSEPEGETLFVRMTEKRGGEAIDFSILTLRKRGGAWTSSLATTPLRALTRETLLGALSAAGFRTVEVFGDYSRAAYDAPGTGDLVAIASL